MKKRLAMAIGVLCSMSMVATGCGSATGEVEAPEATTEVSADSKMENATETKEVTTAEEASAQENAENALLTLVEGHDLVYGTVNLPYADFYYGEINKLKPDFDAEKAQLDKADAVEEADLKADGMYDAVSSATNNKARRYEQTYYEENGEGTEILGVANVNVAISRALYDDAKAQIEAGATCSNALFDIVNNMTVTDTIPSEFKVVGADGTLSATLGNTVVAEGANASFTSISNWGNYQISVEGVELDAATIQGGLIETSDGAVYGLEHNENLWLSPGEIAFAASEFTEPHGNKPGFQRYADIQGKTITKVIYMIANADDIEIDTDFFVNYMLDEQYGITGDESLTYSEDGMEVKYELNVPEDSDYKLTAISFGRAKQDISAVEVSDGVIRIPSSFKPGSYTFVFEDAKYTGLKFSCLLDSGLKDGDVSFNGETFEVGSDSLTAADFIANLSSVTVDGEPVKGKGLSAILFDENGKLLVDAEITSGDAAVPVFAEGKEHEVTIAATGYPSVTFTVER